MPRTLLAIVAGLITAMLLIFGVEAIGLLIFPPPAGMRLDTEADLATLVAMSSPWPRPGWCSAGRWQFRRRLGGGADQSPSLPDCGIGRALFIVAGTGNERQVIAHPMWMNLLGILLPVRSRCWPRALPHRGKCPRKL